MEYFIVDVCGGVMNNGGDAIQWELGGGENK
jgi:hypothetical protein